MFEVSRYQLLRTSCDTEIGLGQGAMSKVKLARDLHTGEQVALKLMYNKDAAHQVRIHSGLDHPNIVRVLDWCREVQRGLTTVVMEYVDGGTLYERMRTNKLNRGFIRSVFRQVCEAVKELHRNGVMHRDIKPENILLTHDGQAKLCDFGLATFGDELHVSSCGTLEYMSPEMFMREPHNYKTDIWSLGILLFEMLTTRPPFSGRTFQEMLDAMKQPVDFPDSLSDCEKQLICSILRVHPHKRPEVKEILQHPYFTQQQNITVHKPQSTKMQSREAFQRASKLKTEESAQTTSQPTSPADQLRLTMRKQYGNIGRDRTSWRRKSSHTIAN